MKDESCFILHPSSFILAIDMFAPQKKSTRIGQWNGRRRSSRSEEPLLTQLNRRSVLLRLGCVLITALGATLLAVAWGAPQPHRVGEICPHDLRARVSFEIVNQVKTEQKRNEAVQQLPPEERTEERVAEVREAVEPVIDPYPRDSLLVQRGQPVTEAQFALLEVESDAYLNSRATTDQIARGVALFLLLTLLSMLVVIYVVRFQHSLARSLPKVVGVCALVLVTLVLALLLNHSPWCAVLVPLTVTALILTIAYNPQFALLMSLSLTLAAVITVGGRLSDLLVAMGGQATAVLILGNVRTRTRLVEVGGVAGAAYFAMTMATELYSGQTWQMIVWDSGRGLLWGLLAGFVVSGLLPLVEYCFTHRHRREPGRAGRRLASAVAGTGAPGAGHLHAQHDGGDAGGAGGRGHRRQPAADARRQLLPRHRQDAQAALFHREPDRREPPRRPGTGPEHAHHHRPRQGRRRPGRAVPAAAADHRLHPAAPRHDLGGVFLSAGAETAGGAGQRAGLRRPAAPAGTDVPLSGAEAA